jgi:hypothetical protein
MLTFFKGLAGNLDYKYIPYIKDKSYFSTLFYGLIFQQYQQQNMKIASTTLNNISLNNICLQSMGLSFRYC